MILNWKGECLSENNVKIPIDVKYFKKDGTPNWEECILHGDNDGFDKNNKEENGEYIIRTTLPIGKRICRYGFKGGNTTTDIGVPYDSISLPYKQDSLPYYEFIVIGECEVECIVYKGKAAQGFGQSGGGVQYVHIDSQENKISLQTCISNKILKEDKTWQKK